MEKFGYYPEGLALTGSMLQSKFDHDSMNHQSDAAQELPSMSSFEFKRARGTLFGLSGGRPSAHERVREKRPIYN